ITVLSVMRAIPLRTSSNSDSWVMPKKAGAVLLRSSTLSGLVPYSWRYICQRTHKATRSACRPSNTGFRALGIPTDMGGSFLSAGLFFRLEVREDARTFAKQVVLAGGLEVGQVAVGAVLLFHRGGLLCYDGVVLRKGQLPQPHHRPRFRCWG